MSLKERLKAAGPKRMLAMDGGGIRGLITLGYLERIESMLRERYGRPDLVLSDYFDLIGGTSTGSIIAAGLAIGKDVETIKKMYLDMGGVIFSDRNWNIFKSLYNINALEKELEDLFGEITLGDTEKIKTGLCVVAKRADTASTWPLINHPDSYYLQKYNHKLPLRRIVRASAAAPVFFRPEEMDIGLGHKGVFIDGGVSMANNPALQLFMIATLKGYSFNWPVGEDNLLLVSIGTGSWDMNTPPEVYANADLLDWAKYVPGLLMNDATWQNQLILQWLSNSKTPYEIDREVGDLRDDTLLPALTYLRYEVMLNEPQDLKELGLDDLADEEKIESLRSLAAAENRYDLARIGAAGAEQQVQADHFPAAFDLH